MNEVLVEVRGLAKHYPSHGGAVRALDGVDFDIHRGQTLALVGESGCGKSTTGQATIRLIEPSAGSIRFEGRDIGRLAGAALRRERRHMQIVFQDPFSSLNPRMRVGDIIGEPLAVNAIGTRRERADMVAELLEVVGLTADHAKRHPHQFSGGQRQRIGIARALALRPKLIVCDEAISALDVSVQAQIINLLKDVQVRFGISYLFISHNLAAVRQIADMVAVMYLGRIVEMAPREDLYAGARHPYTRALMGAIPRVGRAPSERLASVRGELPDAMHPPEGCRYHPRCPLASDRCRQEAPALRQVAPSVNVACHMA